MTLFQLAPKADGLSSSDKSNEVFSRQIQFCKAGNIKAIIKSLGFVVHNVCLPVNDIASHSEDH